MKVGGGIGDEAREGVWVQFLEDPFGFSNGRMTAVLRHVDSGEGAAVGCRINMKGL